MLWEYAQNKKEARQFALPAQKIINGIWLPSYSGLCVKLAYERGLLRTAKRVILVEKDSDSFRQMEQNTTNIPRRQLLNCDLVEVKLDCQIDYAYLDFCGGINRVIARWISGELSPHLASNATICITQMLAKRNNKILSEQDQFLRTEAGTCIRNAYGVLPLPYQRLLLLIHRLFNKWDFQIEGKDGEIYKYADSVSTMLLLKLVNFRCSVTPFPGV